MLISGLVIAKNESRCIARCINSMVDIVDELIVVDTGSTDDTAQIARLLGAEVFEIAWQDNFSAVRNKAMSFVSGEWVVFLDADEFFRKGDAKKVMLFLEELKKTKDYDLVSRIYIDRWDYNYQKFSGETSPEFADTALPPHLFQITANARILRKSDEFAYVGIVHETYGAKDGSNAPSAFVQGIVLYHDGYSGEMLDEKLARNIELLQAELPTAQNERRALVLSYLGSTYLSQNKPAQALPYFQEFVDEKFILYQNAMSAHISYIRTLELTDANEKAIFDACGKVLQNYPAHPSAYLIRAFQYFRFKRFSDCEKDLRRAFELKRGFDFGLEWESGRLFELYPCAYTLAGIICCVRGEFEDGYHFFLAACQTVLWLRQNFGLTKIQKPRGLKMEIAPFDNLIICSRFASRKIFAQHLKILVENQNDLKLLLNKLCLLRCDEVYLDFFAHLNEKSGVYFFMGLLAAEKYESALDFALMHHKKASNESFLPYALLAAVLGGDGTLRKFIYSAPTDYSDAAGGILLGESAALNKVPHLDILLALMESLLAFADKPKPLGKIKELLVTTYGADALLPLARLYYKRMYFEESLRCCLQIIETAPQNYDLRSTVRLFLDGSMVVCAAENYENAYRQPPKTLVSCAASQQTRGSKRVCEKQHMRTIGFSEDAIILALAYEVDLAVVKRYVLWASERDKAFLPWLPRIESWENLYMHDILPQNAQQRQALQTVFEILGDKGTAENLAVRDLLRSNLLGKTTENIKLQNTLQLQLGGLKKSLGQDSTTTQKAAERLQAVRKAGKPMPMLI